MIKWKACYETKIVALDKEHQGLVAQINQLYEAIRQHNSEDILLPLFDTLVDYTRQHFSHEEQLLEEYHYPQLADHQRQHAELTRQVLAYREKLAAGNAVSASDVMAFLRSWLLDHIVKTDIPYGPYLESRGGRFID